MLLHNKAGTGWAAPSDIQKERVCLLPLAPWKTTPTQCTNSNSSHRLSSKPLLSFANSGTWCFILQVGIMWQVSRKAAIGRRTATYLGDWTAAGKCTWQYEKASWQSFQMKLHQISVTNKTGKSYCPLLWVTHYLLYANSDVYWTALRADSLHLPDKNSHTANLSSNDPNKHWGAQSHSGTQQGA